MTNLFSPILKKIQNYLNTRAESKRIMAIREYWQDYAKRRGINQPNIR